MGMEPNRFMDSWPSGLGNGLLIRGEIRRRFDPCTVRHLPLWGCLGFSRTLARQALYPVHCVSIGASPSGKARGFDPRMRRFESFRPSHFSLENTP